LLKIGVVAVVGGLASACHTTLSHRIIYDPTPAVERLRRNGTIETEVDALAKPLIEKHESVGIVVGVLTPDGKTQVFSYGQRAAYDPTPPTTNTLFAVGSVTKMLVAATLARLVEEGAVRYEDTVRSIVPPSIPLSKSVGETTLYQLVTHTSGLKREPANLESFLHLVRYLFTGQNVYDYLTRDYLYHYLNECHLPPAKLRRYEYSNVGGGLLGNLLELKTGMSLPNLVAEKVTIPLGLSDTVFYLNDERRERRAVGHSGDEPLFMPRNIPQPIWDLGEVMRGAGGMWSTVDDLLILAKAELGMIENPVATTMDACRKVQFELPDEGIALGWRTNRIDDHLLYYIHGVMNGHTAYIGLNEKTSVAVVVLCNNFNWDDKVGHNLLLRLSSAYTPGHTQLIFEAPKISD
jgi:CubicO group peptidase (beta-lactamase class C family)